MDNQKVENKPIIEYKELEEPGVVPKEDTALLDKFLAQVLPYIQRQTEVIFNQLKYLRIGGENKVIKMNDQYGMWVGHAEYASAPFKVDILDGKMYIGGTLKTAVVKTLDGLRELYCLESPEVWFMDFCKKVETPESRWYKREYKYDVDAIFLQATQAPYHFIPTLDKKTFMVFGKRRFHTSKRFERVSEEEYKKNEEFWKGQRIQHKSTNKV